MGSTDTEVVLVLGSFPPQPPPASAATVAAIRRELAAGRAVVTASPRPSAASLVVRVCGPLGAWRLEQARRSARAARLVLSVEPGWPLPPAVRTILRRFSSVSLLVSGVTPAVLGTLGRLRPVVEEVVLSGQAARPEAVAAIAQAAPTVPLRIANVPAVGTPLDGATPLGPTDSGRSEPMESLGPGLAALRARGTSLAGRAVGKVRRSFPLRR